MPTPLFPLSSGRPSCAFIFIPTVLIPRVMAFDWIKWMVTRKGPWRNMSSSINALSIALLAIVTLILATLGHILVEPLFARLVAN
ncbi:uncharacterized protein BJX67DRAFT_350670 [Aspergillus lucknowensis]|uniref:Uncharacterized protein n=1 Tax=Aspergillus lucknowensis TaxID=176173 RepID=A0ABR4LV19_9EURO